MPSEPIRRTSRWSACAAALLALAGCKNSNGAAAAPDDPYSTKIGLVTDVGGRGDQSFNDSALRGLEIWAAGLSYAPNSATGYKPMAAPLIQASIPPDLSKIPLTRLPVVPVILHSKSQEDYEPNLQLEVDNGAALVVGVGFMMEKAVESVARKNPSARFLLIDSPLLDAHNSPYTLPNVSTITFREQEGSFLAGVVAGSVTTGKVGFVGGMELPLIKKFEAGFRAGVMAVNPNAQVLISYTGSFDNPGAGKQAGQDLLSKGADIIFHAAGSDGSGVISSVKDARAAGKAVWVIGCDSDQQHLAPEAMLTSMVKHVDLAVWETIQRALDHTLRGGDEQWGLKEAGVGLAPLRNDLPKREQVLAVVGAWSKLITGGQLHVPATLEELASFKPPSPPVVIVPAAPAAPPPAVTR